MNLESIRNEIAGWQKLDRLLDEQFNNLDMHMEPDNISTNGCSMALDIDGVTSEAFNTLFNEDRKRLREAWFESECDNVTMDERNAVHKYIKTQIHTLHRQLMDEVAAIIIPDTEAPE